jgi:preprotein translocase subunit SecD
MRRGTLTLLYLIILLAVGASFINFWPTTPINLWPAALHNVWPRSLKVGNFTSVHEGLDLQGGVSVVLVPSNPNQHPTATEMQQAANQIGLRVISGLGVTEPDIRVQTTNGQPSIAVELPGLNGGNQQEALKTVLQTGNLQFWDTGQTPLQNNTPFDPTQYATSNGGTQPLFTGKDLDPNSLGVAQNSTGAGYVITFAMQGSAATKLSTWTANHIGDYLTTTLDGQVINSAVIQNQLPGSGQIQGNFTLQQAQELVNVFKYGALPIPLTIASQNTVGPTLGQDAIQKSLLAGAIGLGVVILFMLLYYRLPGFLADLALALYAMVTFAIFKLIAITFSLAGIAGFILSVGMAVDANVLIFERVKEELRAGRLLSAAIDAGWRRAWPSIRDSNISTMITCAVLFFFGNNFGETIIVSFAMTLFIGVAVSMFTAVVVTRTFLNLLVPTGAINHPALFGVPADAIATTPAKTRPASTV